MAEEVAGSPNIVAIANGLGSNKMTNSIQNNIFGEADCPPQASHALLDGTACPRPLAVRHENERGCPISC